MRPEHAEHRRAGCVSVFLELCGSTGWSGGSTRPGLQVWVYKTGSTGLGLRDLVYGSGSSSLGLQVWVYAPGSTEEGDPGRG
eukprot:7686831-Pyramimonas_sp.AAC.1